MNFKHSLNIVISGEAGQGLETCIAMICSILHNHCYHVFSQSEYMSRIRGGANSSLIKVSSAKSDFFEEKIDLLFSLSPESIFRLKKRIKPSTVIFSAPKNTYVTGFVCALFYLDKKESFEFLNKKFKKIFEDEKNREYFFKGYDECALNNDISVEIKKDESISDKILVCGNDMAAFGSVCGGCNMTAFYPMSPSTTLASKINLLSDEFNIIVEQTEDEIASINMAIGASYAGARSLVTTSGGGFALMCEGVSLAGMIETPVVINIASRPGPATGMPTRTAQEDFNLALYCGHGEFERIILSPKNIYEHFVLAHKAFNLADKYQIPVFLLTEMSLLESISAVKMPDINEFENQYYIEKSKKDYKRYLLTKNGISPRSVPLYGEGLVRADSNEHDEEGLITEDFDMREKMVQKRLKRRWEILNDYIEPELTGDFNYKTLVVSYGSNYEVLKANLAPSQALLHFSQLYPIKDEVRKYFNRANKVVVVEQNANAQFCEFLEGKLYLKIADKFLKYNGMPISLEEAREFLNGIR